MIWRFNMQVRVQGSNSRIQFASNEPKLVLTNLDLGPLTNYIIAIPLAWKKIQAYTQPYYAEHWK
jgi:hypothetical protein